MSTTKEVISAMNAVLKPLGTRRKRNTWFLAGPEVTAVLNLQKSQFGGGGYLNVGFVLHSLAAQEPGSFSSCHVYCRLSDLVNPAASGFDWVEIDDSGQLQGEPLEELQARILKHAVSILQKGTTLSGVIELVKNRVCVLMDPDARTFLDQMHSG